MQTAGRPEILAGPIFYTRYRKLLTALFLYDIIIQKEGIQMLLMVHHFNHRPNKRKEVHIKEDIGTCFNCRYQGTGSESCKKCARAPWAPTKATDNFRLKQAAAGARSSGLFAISKKILYNIYRKSKKGAKFYADCSAKSDHHISTFLHELEQLF